MFGDYSTEEMSNDVEFLRQDVKHKGEVIE